MNLVSQALREMSFPKIGAAGFGGDGEARRHWQPQARHLCKVCPLAAEKIRLKAITLSKGEDVVRDDANLGTQTHVPS